MKYNKWTLGLAAVGVVSLASVVKAEEKLSPILGAVSSTIISGYVDTSAVWRPGNQTAASWSTPGLIGQGAGNAVTQNKADGFNLNVVKLAIEKPLDEKEWAAGYKGELLFGPDAVGWNPSANGNATTDYAIKQAYVALRAPVGNGLDLKLGVFDTVVGYESFDSCDNPHYSRSYGWNIEPTEHTGLLASYKVADALTIKGGVANTAAAGVNARPVRLGNANVQDTEKTYMAAIELTAPESFGFLKGSKLYAGIVDGLAGGSTDTTWVYAGATLNTPLEALTFGAAFDYRWDGKISGQYGSGKHAMAVGAYTSIKPTEKLKFNVRVEYAKGTESTWYVVPATTSEKDNALLGVTGTLDYSLWANAITRFEARYDRDLTNLHPGPFGNGAAYNAYFALNVIYKF